MAYCEDRKILVLQGGGALGAYQAGAYEELVEAGYLPSWVAGISIGAVNAAIIAGNPHKQRVERLRQFWNRVSSRLIAWPLGTTIARASSSTRRARRSSLTGASRILRAKDSSSRVHAAGHAGGDQPLRHSPLRETLLELVDFDLLNSGPVRFSVGAVQVRTGNMKYFDTTAHKIRPEHVMASGALPPGFPPVMIDGEAYWDGGLVSTRRCNTCSTTRPARGHRASSRSICSAPRAGPEDPLRHRPAREGNPLFEPHPPEHRRVPRAADHTPRRAALARLLPDDYETSRGLAGFLTARLRRRDNHRAAHSPPRSLLDAVERLRVLALHRR